MKHLVACAVGAALWIAGATSAFGQMGETCDQPIVLPGEGTFAFDNTGFAGSGFSGGGCGAGGNYGNDIFFEFVVPTTGRYRFILHELDDPLGVTLYRGDRCSATCFGSMPNGSILTNTVTAGEKLLVQVGNLNGPGGAGLLTVGIDLCLSLLDDAFEDNDTPADAAPLAAGDYDGLVVAAGDDDYYSFTLQPGEELAVLSKNAFPGFFFFGADFSSPTPGAEVLGGDMFRALTCINDSSTAPKNVLLRVSTSVCTQYELQVNVTLGCAFAASDAFEPNDTCLVAAPLDAGLTQDLTLSEGELDFYSVQIPPLTTATLRVEESYFRSVGLRAYDGACAPEPDAPTSLLRISNTSATTVLSGRFEAAIDGSGQLDCTSYAIDVQFDASDCTSLPADGFEPNDSCQTAAPIFNGEYDNLTIGLAEVDYYTFTMQPFQRLFARATAVGNNTLNMRLLNENCEVIQEGSNFVLLGTIDETAIQELTLEVTVDAFSASPCLSYLLEFSLEFDPCSPFLEDDFEPNDTCETAVPIGDGLYSQLSVTAVDDDFFDVLLNPGEIFRAETLLSANASSSGVNLFLWSLSGPCGSGSGGTPVASSTSFTSSESLTYVHAGPTPQRYVLEVALATAPFCTRYDLTIEGAAGRPVGVNYCVAASNSTGGRAAISGLGSASAIGNQLRLTTTSLPANTFGFYLVSRMQGLVVAPGGSVGRLCLGGSIGRYQRPGEIMNAGPAGEFSLDLDLTDTPQPLGSASVLPGDTWSWTTWFRDQEGGVAVSNFSNGLEVLFL